MESYSALRHKLNLLDDIPYTPDWSAAADFLDIIVNHCLSEKPSTIVECSSGLTSLMLARCCEINHFGKVYSLEDGKVYAENTRDFIRKYQLNEYASIFHSPLTTVNLNGSDFMWYSLEALPERTIEMLVIDGPNGFLQKNSRYPALPLLYEKLSDNCTIFLDDAARDDEKEIVELWRQQFPSLVHQYVETERGCSILKIDRSE
ncbi:MAG: class I SAM-dependent methyltransferase [Gammaproteobacteria bacterium]|nr:class I SAM-dependent methyltransferase [Gammaproteobacteria bacterium]